MAKRLLLGMMIVCLLALPLSARISAQTESAWTMTLFDLNTANLYVMTPDGMETYMSFPQLLEYGQINDAQMSPDQHWLAVNITSNDGHNHIYAANVWDNVCCTELVDPLNSGLTIKILGPFSPNSSSVAVSLAAFPTDTGFKPTNLVQTFEVATGQLVGVIATSDIGEGAMVVIFGEWLEDGLRVAPSCYGCEPPIEGVYSIWNPFLGGVQPSSERYNMFMDVLPATSEGIRGIQNTAFPESGIPSAYFPPSNVVQYYADGSTNGQVVYANPTNHYIMDTHWVLDGNAVLVSLGGALEFEAGSEVPFPNYDGESYLLFRDGSTMPVMQQVAQVLVGTPDGWLARDPADGHIYYNYLTETDTIETYHYMDNANVLVVHTDFTLGTSAQGSFPPVSPPIPTTCPGFIPSRLAVNSIGHVLPGDPNNLRSDPTISSTYIGQMPGDGLFIVLDGPVCAENMAWWQVNYKGLIGWTAEGQDQEYWIEPATDLGF